jgi:formylglycine-generating enzyme required for sulfatase activity
VDLKDANGNNLSLDYVREFYLEGSYWQVNSEFDKGDDIEVTVERSSAAIMLVLDCSSSLQSDGDKFTEMKTHVKAFIETLAAAMDDVDPGTSPNPDPQPGNGQTYTVNGVSFTMIPVEGGTFQMGSTTGYDIEKPVHQVTLSSFSIGQTEVTQELWQAVMGSNPSYSSGSKRPVEQVSWNDCRTFITKLNQLTGKTFRLPTEAEWEYAARGGNKSKGYVYSGSNEIDDVAWYNDNSGNTTHNVATKSPNELGIYDMSGNVWEWCQDWYGSYSSGSQTNPTGPTSGSYRVRRGGCWGNAASGCRVALRDYRTPTNSSDYLGLRLAQ